jgi:hypothetical protein
LTAPLFETWYTSILTSNNRTYKTRNQNSHVLLISYIKITNYFLYCYCALSFTHQHMKNWSQHWCIQTSTIFLPLSHNWISWIYLSLSTALPWIHV